MPDRPGEEFTAGMRELERAYLEANDPVRQSGFSGGRQRWIAERSPLVDGINTDGDFLDVGCANGLLVQDVVDWAATRGHSVTPHGVDLGPGLIELARERLPRYTANFHAVDAWEWAPDRQWRFVYSLLDLSPRDLWCEWLHRLQSWVEPDGHLIVGSYGGRTPPTDPDEIAVVLSECGLDVVGSSNGGHPLVTRFAWAMGASR